MKGYPSFNTLTTIRTVHWTATLAMPACLHTIVIGGCVMLWGKHVQQLCRIRGFSCSCLLQKEVVVRFHTLDCVIKLFLIRRAIEGPKNTLLAEVEIGR